MYHGRQEWDGGTQQEEGDGKRFINMNGTKKSTAGGECMQT